MRVDKYEVAPPLFDQHVREAISSGSYKYSSPMTTLGDDSTGGAIWVCRTPAINTCKTYAGSNLTTLLSNTM